MNRRLQRGFTLIELFIVFVFIGAIVLGGTGLYVLWHFISKFW